MNSCRVEADLPGVRGCLLLAYRGVFLGGYFDFQVGLRLRSSFVKAEKNV